MDGTTQLERAMKKLVGISAMVTTAFLMSTWADSTMADQWRCVVEKKVGAKLKKDLKPTEFYLNDEEFRILDRQSIVKQYETDPREGLWDFEKTASYYVRDASDDPREADSWFALEHPTDTEEGEAPASLWTDETATIFFGDLRMHVASGRFQHTKLGGYAWQGPAEGDDPVFAFGTCRPYYD